MTPTDSNRALLGFAVDAAFEAGQLTLAHFQTGVQVDWKADDSPVTRADREAEAALRRRIESRFPRHAIVGEEMGVAAGDATHRWIIDPIDGTQSFIRGVPLYGVLVGLEIAGDMVVGVSYFPALGEMVAAARGEGCRWNGRDVRVSQTDSLSHAALAFTDSAFWEREDLRHRWQALQGSVRSVRGWGDCYGHCLVATGRVDAMIDPIMNLWDCAALLPILEEAGGRFTDWQGQARADGGTALGTNARIHEALLRLLSET